MSDYLLSMQTYRFLVPTFLPHSSLYTLLQAAVLASVAGVFLNGAGATASACVAGVGSNAAAEETLAGLAAEDAEMVAGGGVAAHSAEGLAHSRARSLRGQSQGAGCRLHGLRVVRVAEVTTRNVAIRGGRRPKRGVAKQLWVVVAAGHSAVHWIHVSRECFSGVLVLVAVLRRRVVMRRPGISWRRRHLGQKLQLRLFEFNTEVGLV